MHKPRYDENEDVSRHGAADARDCENMRDKYDWELKRVEPTPQDPVFGVDCVFEGKTEFPKSYFEQEEDKWGVTSFIKLNPMLMAGKRAN